MLKREPRALRHAGAGKSRRAMVTNALGISCHLHQPDMRASIGSDRHGAGFHQLTIQDTHDYKPAAAPLASLWALH